MKPITRTQRCPKGHKIRGEYRYQGRRIVLLGAIKLSPLRAAQYGLEQTKWPSRAYLDKEPPDQPIGCRCGVLVYNPND